MIVQIRTRDDRGRWRDALPGDFADAALRRIHSDGQCWKPDPWGWLMYSLAKFCLHQAADHISAPTAADIWIRRYQAIRGIE